MAPFSAWSSRVGTLHQVGLLRPIPEALRDDLQAAAAGKAGFLMKDEKAVGSTSYSADWEIDLAELARKLKGSPREK